MLSANWCYLVNIVHKDIVVFFEDALVSFEKHFRAALNEHGALKVYSVFGENSQRVLNDKEVIEFETFIAETNKICPTTLLEDSFIDYVREPILRKIEELEEAGSDWKLFSIERFEININRYNPTRASSYIDSSETIKKKKTCINIHNFDKKCFQWAVLSALHPVDYQLHSCVSHYKQYESKLYLGEIEFPVTLKDILKIEERDEISINIYGLISKGNYNYSVVPFHLTSQKGERHVNLLHIQDQYISSCVLGIYLN